MEPIGNSRTTSVENRIRGAVRPRVGPCLFDGVTRSQDLGIQFGMVMHLPLTLAGFGIADFNKVRLRMTFPHKLFIR